MSNHSKDEQKLNYCILTFVKLNVKLILSVGEGVGGGAVED